MTSIWFVVPTHGRVDLTRVCLRNLDWTCQKLSDAGVNAGVVVVADDDNLETAWELGFETVEHPNQPLGAKLNAGYEHAAHAGADWLIPLGSDDLIDPKLVLAQLDADGEMRCTRLSAVVREDGRMLARLRIPYDGGDGVRMIPAVLIAPFGYRPCDDTAIRAIDTTTWRRLTGLLGRPPRVSYRDVHPLQIVDFKTGGSQLNPYAGCLAYRDGDELRDPWTALAEHYPLDTLAALRVFYDSAGPSPTPAAPPTQPVDTIDVTVTRESLQALAGMRPAG